MHRVVITGMGAITPIGQNVETFWENAKAGTLGISQIEQIDTADLKVKLAGEIKDFDPLVAMDAKEAKRSSRVTQIGMAAAKEAIEQSGIIGNVDLNRLATIVGCGIGGIAVFEEESKKVFEGKASRVSPFMVPMMIPNMLGGQIAIKYGAKGICNCPVTACATGTYAIGDAFELVASGRVDAAICGGGESTITPTCLAGFANMTALSDSDDPARASIPFDKERTGFVMGEGAGILVIESLEHAQSRGAKILGEIVGYGATCDAYHITAPAPDGDGAIRSMQAAIARAGIEANEVKYINAHGTGTPANDKCETAAIKAVWGENSKNLLVNSTKSMIGHLLGGAGAVESVICIKTLQEGIVHPTIGYKVPDEELDLNYVTNGAIKANLEYALSNSLGFGGHNGTLLFKKWSLKWI